MSTAAAPVRRRAASLADAVLSGLGTGEKPAAVHPPMRTDAMRPQGSRQCRAVVKGVPSRGNDFTRQAHITRREPGIEGAGHAPTDERRGAGLDQRSAPRPPPPLPCRSPRRACRP